LKYFGNMIEKGKKDERKIKDKDRKKGGEGNSL
jgi:hypothetical protein